MFNAPLRLWKTNNGDKNKSAKTTPDFLDHENFKAFIRNHDLVVQNSEVNIPIIIFAFTVYDFVNYQNRLQFDSV